MKHLKKRRNVTVRGFFQTYYDGVCYSYYESEKHYFYCHDGNVLKRISAQEYVTAYEAHQNY